MNRFMPWLVAASIVVIAASLSAVLYLAIGMSLGEAGWIGVAALFAMLIGQFYSARDREASGLTMRLDDIGGTSGRLSRELESLNMRIADLEVALGRRLDESIDERLTSVLGEIGRIEQRLGEIARSGLNVTVEHKAPAGTGEVSADAGTTAGETEAPPRQTPERSPAFKGVSDEQMLAMAREAVEAGRIEVHLQPVVTLPQRKVRYYEALARLRTESGDLMMPDDFMPFVTSGGLIPAIDFTILVRAVQIVRRLASRNRDVGIFLNVGLATLQDERFATQYIEFVGHNTALAGSIVFEFAQDDFSSLGTIEQAGIAALTEHGFRLSIDAIERLVLDAKSLSEQRVRFVKVDADMLLEANGGLGADIHPADLSDLLARFGIDLIAVRIERESEVVDLIDYDVRFAQGNLFSPPRPVKPDVLKDSTGSALEAAQ